MAKIHILKKIIGGVKTAFYPLTIPQAVIDPTSGKSVRTELDEKAKHGYESNPKTLKSVDDAKADHGYDVEETQKTLKEVDTLATQNAEDITQLAGNVEQIFTTDTTNLFDINNFLIRDKGANITYSLTGSILAIVNSGSVNEGISIYLPAMDAAKQYIVQFTAVEEIRFATVYFTTASYISLTATGNIYSVKITGGSGFWLNITIGNARTVHISDISVKLADVPSHVDPALVLDLPKESLSEILAAEISSSVKSSDRELTVIRASNIVLQADLSITAIDERLGAVTIQNTSTTVNRYAQIIAPAVNKNNYKITFTSSATGLCSIVDSVNNVLASQIVAVGENTISFDFDVLYYQTKHIIFSVRVSANSSMSISDCFMYNTKANQIAVGSLIDLPAETIKRRYDVPCNKIYFQPTGDDIDIFTNGLIDTDTRDGEYSVFANNAFLSIKGVASRFRIDVSASPVPLLMHIYDRFGYAKPFWLKLLSSGVPVNPGTEKYILMIGDSLTGNRTLPTEFRRYLNNAGMTNWQMVGRVQIETDITGVNYEAQGGYAWPNYVDDPATLPAAYPNNYFWDPVNEVFSPSYYFTTHCGGVYPSVIICNIGWNHYVNSSFINMTSDEIKAKCLKFIDGVHADYPDCKIILTGLARGLPNNPDHYHKGYLNAQVEMANIYQSIADDAAYASFVLYGNVAPYYDGVVGVNRATRNASNWTTDQETYVIDEVHPNDAGYKMLAYALYLHFLYLVNN